MMKDDYSALILSRMIDRYERTSAFREGAAPARRIILNFYGRSKTDFPEYDIEDYQVRTVINSTVCDLAQKNYIFYEWMRGQEDHILMRAWLNFEKLGEIYKLLKRIPKRELIMAVVEELSQLIKGVNTDWILQFYSDTARYMKEQIKFSSLLPEDEIQRRDIYKLLSFIDGNSDSVLTERVFSEKCYGDSKYFESRVKSLLLSILRRYLSPELNDSELLQAVGIGKYPQQLEMCGKIAVNSSDMSMLETGFCIYSDDIDKINLSIDKSVSKIITIENRANYFAYLKSCKACDELVIYHGGHYSPAKKRLFVAVLSTMPEGCKWYHWGDIDFGGFSMLLRLRKEISPSILPYRMNKGELEKYKIYTLPFNDGYREKLAGLYESDLLLDCRECLGYMINHGIKLEQEAMLT